MFGQNDVFVHTSRRYGIYPLWSISYYNHLPFKAIKTELHQSIHACLILPTGYSRLINEKLSIPNAIL